MILHILGGQNMKSLLLTNISMNMGAGKLSHCEVENVIIL